MKWTTFTWKILWIFFVFINTQFATTWKVLTFFKYLEYNIFHGIHENRRSKWCFSIWKFFDCPDQLNFARVLVFEQRSSLVLINVFCIDGYSCFRYRNELFSAVFQVLDWSFLELHFYGNVCNWMPKVIWPRMDWFWGFLLENGFFRWLLICID